MRVVLVTALAMLLAVAPARAQDPAELAFWETVKDSKNPEELQAYIDGYPTGKFVPLAKIRLRALQGGAGAAPAKPAAPATVALSNNGLTVNKSAFAPFEEMTLVWTGIKAVNGAVGFGAPGETKLTQQQSVTFSTQPTGKFTFPGLITGKYEARILTGNYGSETVVARIPIEVRDPPAGAAFRPRIAPDKPAFGPMEKIAVTWNDIRAPNGTVALYQDGNPRALDTYSVTFFYDKRFTGNHAFNGKAPGKYEVRVLTGEYGKETVIARAPIQVGDAPQAGPGSQVAALTDGPMVKLNGVVLSEIGRLALAESPKRVNDAGLRARMLAAAPELKCGATELFAWAVADQQRLDAILGTTAQAMRVRGYNVAGRTNAGGLTFAAVSVVPKVEDPALFALWSLQPGGLNMLLCRPERKP